MTRHRHARSEGIEPARPRSTGTGAHLPPGAAALLALQRQAGNAAVSRMIEPQRMPGAWPQPAEEAPGPPMPPLSSFGETAVDVDEIPAPRPSLSTIAEESEPETDAGTEPASPMSERTRRSSLDDLPPRPSAPTPDAARHNRKAPPYLNGDLPKAVGAGVAALTVPPMNMRLVGSTVPNLGSGATGMASATAAGDAASEVVKWLQGSGFNLPKFLGGVLAAGGLVANAVGQRVTDPALSNRVRYGGLAVQSAGLMTKAVGEAYKFEKGMPDLRKIPSGDIAKAVGAFVASAAPILTATAIDFQRRMEREIAAGARSGRVPTAPMAVAAALLGGGSAAGDFSSELVKAIRDGKVNVPKMIGGLLGMIGAVTLTAGVATGSPGARYAGLGLQDVGLGFKSAGEARKWEDTRAGRLRPPEPEWEMMNRA